MENPIIIGGNIGNYGYVIDENDQSYAIGVVIKNTAVVNKDCEIELYGNLLIDPNYFVNLGSESSTRYLIFKGGNKAFRFYFNAITNWFTIDAVIKDSSGNWTINGVSGISVSFGISSTPSNRLPKYIFLMLTPDAYKLSTSRYGALFAFHTDGLPLEHVTIRHELFKEGAPISKEMWDNFFSDIWDEIPYDGENSGNGGFHGSFDKKSDNIEFPELPSVVDCLSHIYIPNETELNELAQYLWTTDFIEGLMRFQNDPIDNIINFAVTYAPIPIPETKSSIMVGNMNSHISSYELHDRFIYVDFGEILIEEYWGNFLDYNPYTKIEIYLPYIGFREINTDDFMGKTLRLKYSMDLMTGSCIAFLMCVSSNMTSVLYNFEGNCFSQIPLSGSTISEFYASLVLGLGVGIASGSAALGAVTTFSTLSKPNAIQKTSFNNAMDTLNNTSQNMVDSFFNKASVSRASRADSTYGMMGVKRPYLVIHRPITSKPENYNQIIGYPSNVTSKLSDLSGFTIIDYVHLENIPATEAELSLIEQLLKSGVIL